MTTPKLSRLVSRLSFSLAASALALLCSAANADTIYRETFGNNDNANRKTPNLFGWQAFDNTGNFFDTTGSGFGIDTGATLGRPTDVANINAGGNVDGSTGALAGGRPFWNGAHRMMWTPEYQIDPANYQAGSIVFSFYLGDAQAADTVRFMVRVGTTWYVSATTFSSLATASADFSTTAVFSSLTYNPAAANWLVLNFDGTYNGGGYLGGPTAAKTASTINPVSIGATPGADLSGVITGFGIIQGNVAANPAGNIRFDTFQVDAIPGSGGGPTINGTNVWKGTVDGNWDYTTLNWATLSAVQTNYPQSSFAIFNDAVLNNNTNINLTTTLTNAGMLVSNSTAHYIWGGQGNIVGSGGLTKLNNGTLIIANAMANPFSGPVDLEAGTIQLGNGNSDVNAGNLGSGAFTNNGALIVNMGPGGSVTVNNSISGSGTVANVGSGTLSLGGNSTYPTGLTVSNGPVRLTSTGGAGTGTLNVNNNAMLIASTTIGAPLVVSNGFLGSANMGTAATGPAYATNSVTFVTGTASTIMIADPQNLTGTSSSEVHFPGALHGGGDINVIGDPGHSIDAGAGFRLQGSNVSDYSGVITISNTAKAELQTFVAGPFSPVGTGKLRLEGGAGSVSSGAELNLRNSSGTNATINTDMEIIGTGTVSFNAPAVQSPISIGNLKVGDGQVVGANKNNAVFIFPTVTLNGGISTFAPGTVGLGAGSGPASISLGAVSELVAGSGMTVNGSNTVILTGDATYTGSTFVSNGVFAVNGRILSTAPVSVVGDGGTTGGMLSGTGAISGPVTIGDFGTLQPGTTNVPGTLSLSSTLNLNGGSGQGTNTMKLNRAAAPNADLVQGITSLTAGGTLNVVNVGPTLFVPGDSFKLYNFTGHSGTFGVVLLPTLNTPLSWNTSTLLTSGTISVTVSPSNDKLWTGSVDGNWDTATANWKANNVSTTYADNDLVRFNDTATRTTVNIGQTVAPGLIIVSNNAADFTFAGSAKISGTAGLVKLGNGSLALMENGDDFSSGIYSGGGTLILSNTAVNISGGLSVTNGTVVLAQSGTFSGNTTISGGVVQVGNNTASGDLPTGTIANNGVIVFNRASATTVPGAISGTGQLIQSGTNIVKLAAANTYTGGTLVTNGFLQVSGNTSLGTAGPANTVMVTNGGSLDLGGGATANSITLQATTVQVSGSGMTNGGAIMNTGLNQQNGLTNVTMLGDTVFGGVGDWHATGNPGRWDIRGATSRLNTGGQPFKLTKVGGNQVALVNTTVDPELGDIDIQGGQFGYESGTTSLGNPSSNLFVRAGATLEFFATTNVLNKVITIFGDGVTTNIFFNGGIGGSTNSIVGPMTLSSGTMVVGGGAAGSFSNIISGAGDFAVNGGAAQRVVMASSNLYTGNTIVRGGTLALVGTARLTNSPAIVTSAGGVLDLSALGSLAMATGQVLTNGGVLTTGAAGTLTAGTGSTVVNSGSITAATFTATSTSTVIDNGSIVGNLSAGSGATIAGNGTVVGNLTLNAGGLLSPGGAGGIGRLTATLSPSLGSSPTSNTKTLIEIDKSNLATNDQVFASGAIIYGGTLTVSNIGPALVAGDTFKVFNASTYVLSFTLDLADPGTGLAWNTNNLTVDGTLSVISAASGPTTNANITKVTLSGANLLIHGTNNNVPNNTGHYVVLTSTNISAPLSSWTPVVTNLFNADGTFDYSSPIVPGTLQQFIEVQAVP